MRCRRHQLGATTSSAGATIWRQTSPRLTRSCLGYCITLDSSRCCSETPKSNGPNWFDDFLSELDLGWMGRKYKLCPAAKYFGLGRVELLPGQVSVLITCWGLGQAGDRSRMPVMWAKLRQAAKRCCLLSFATRHEPDHAPCTFKPPGDGDHFFHRLLNVVFTDELMLTTSQNNSTGF
jgi:hypothetical protein